VPYINALKDIYELITSKYLNSDEYSVDTYKAFHNILIDINNMIDEEYRNFEEYMDKVGLDD